MTDGMEPLRGGLTDEQIKDLRAYYREHGSLPPEYEKTLVERQHEAPRSSD